MLTPALARILPRTLIAAAVLFAVAAPAGAKVVYRWKTDDGVYAFTDDAKRIPEKYRTQAKASPLRPLHTYKQYTPAQRSGTQAYLRGVEKSAREMSKLNARLSGQGAAMPTGTVYGEPSDEAVLRVGTAGQSNVEVQTSGLGSGEPIVIEQKRYYVPGMNSTRTDTVVRQGGRILAITKPLAHQDDISDIESESVLDE
jgi:Tfp pilus assembly protein PilE